MEWFEALLLGLIQGLTEFLPVSSSGHLIIGKELLGIEVRESAATTFEVVVHSATVLSTLFVFRKDIGILLSGVLKFQYNNETQYLLKIGISMIPILIVGLFFKENVEALFTEGMSLVGWMLLVTSALLSIAYFCKKGNRPIKYGNAFIIGLAQTIAVLPGLSRSGATIATGLILGIKKEEIAKFSFLMVLIPILGETVLMMFKGEFSPAASGIPVSSLMIGFVSAFISGLFACKIMIAIVNKSKLIYFAAYCFVIGLIAIFFSM